MKFGAWLLALVAMCACAETATAQDNYIRPVTSVYTIEAGSSHMCDTYLTPLKYSGWQMALGYERWQAMKFNPENWVMNLRGRLSVDRDLNPARNAAMWGLDVTLDWAMLRRFDIPGVSDLSLAVGGRTAFDGGVLYLSRNSNNPASAKAAWTIGLSAQATYRKQIKKLPVVFGYGVSMPVTGIFFSPDYDELYYEIYLGNRSKLVNCVWPGNYFRLEQLVSADLKFGATWLRLGYRCGIFSSKANNIVSRHISHCFCIGVSGEWISIGRDSKLDTSKKIVSAY